MEQCKKSYDELLPSVLPASKVEKERVQYVETLIDEFTHDHVVVRTTLEAAQAKYRLLTAPGCSHEQAEEARLTQNQTVNKTLLEVGMTQCCPALNGCADARHEQVLY